MSQSSDAPLFVRLSPWSQGVSTLRARSREQIEGIIVHRIEVSQEDSSFGDSPREVERFFVEHPIGKKATGGDMPYPLIIEADGKITQTLPFNLIAPHAVAANPSTIGLALIGDFREQAPSGPQMKSLLQTCIQLVMAIGIPTEKLSEHLRGHDEIPGASRDPDKECPGRILDMTDLRRRVSQSVSQIQAENTAQQMEFAWDAGQKA